MRRRSRASSMATQFGCGRCGYSTIVDTSSLHHKDGSSTSRRIRRPVAGRSGLAAFFGAAVRTQSRHTPPCSPKASFG